MLRKLLRPVYTGAAFLFASIWAAATIISLIKRAYEIPLYSTPETVFGWYEWVRNNIFDAIYLAVFDWWWIDFSLPNWSEDIISAYLLVGFAAYRSREVNKLLRNTADEETRAYLDSIPTPPKLSHIQKLRRRLLYFLRTVFGWPSWLWSIFRSSFVVPLKHRASIKIYPRGDSPLEPAPQPPPSWWKWAAANNRSSLTAMVITLSGTAGLVWLFFYWNKLESLAMP